MVRLLLIFFLMPHIAIAGGFSKGEQACFDMVDAQDFVPEPVDARYRVLKGLRRCVNAKNQYACVLKDRRVRRSKNVLQLVYDTRVRTNLVTFGNLGWARQNLTIINDDLLLTDALLIARGVENSNVGNPVLEAGDLLDHNLFVEEIKCTEKTPKCRRIRRKYGVCQKSFNEVQEIY